MSYIEKKVINIWIITIIVILLILISLSFFKYQPYILTYGEISDDYINIFLTDQEITELNNKLKYHGEIKDYEITNVSSNYIFHENQLKRNVKIKFDHNDAYIVEFYLAIGEEVSIWENFYKKYMKGAI